MLRIEHQRAGSGINSNRLEVYVISIVTQSWLTFPSVTGFPSETGLLVLLACTLAAAGLLAAILPLRPAASIEPMNALRTE